LNNSKHGQNYHYIPRKNIVYLLAACAHTDINYGQHLAHDKLISMLHEARAQFFLHFNMEESNVGGLGIILSDLAICYQAESFHPDTLNIEMALDDASRCGCDMVYRISKDADNTLVATAKTGLVFFDYNNKKSFINSERI